MDKFLAELFATMLVSAMVGGVAKSLGVDDESIQKMYVDLADGMSNISSGNPPPPVDQKYAVEKITA